MSGLMFTYPVHQAADILFCKATLVPVGTDQLPHLELTRLDRPPVQPPLQPGAALFPEPDALLAPRPLLLGTDGQKMSKSRGNAIAARRDRRRDRAADRAAPRPTPSGTSPTTRSRRPEVSNLVLLAALCLDRGAGGRRRGDRRRAAAAALKRLVTEAVNERFRDIRARRAELTADPGYLRDVLRAGNQRAQQIAAQTLAEVRQLMHTDYPGLRAGDDPGRGGPYFVVNIT